MKLTVKELDVIHSALVTRERVLREDWIPAWGEDSERGKELKVELAAIPSISYQICCAKLSMELGFDITPV